MYWIWGFKYLFEQILYNIISKWSIWASFLTDLTEFQFYMLLISNNLKKQYDGRHFLSYYEWILSQILLFDKWILMFSFTYNIVWIQHFFPILYFMNFFPDDQSLLHDICVDLFNLIFLGCCSSYNSGIILWLKEKIRHLVSLLW